MNPIDFRSFLRRNSRDSTFKRTQIIPVANGLDKAPNLSASRQSGVTGHGMKRNSNSSKRTKQRLLRNVGRLSPFHPVNSCWWFEILYGLQTAASEQASINPSGTRTLSHSSSTRCGGPVQTIYKLKVDCLAGSKSNEHEWFINFRWSALYSEGLCAPVKPSRPKRDRSSIRTVTVTASVARSQYVGHAFKSIHRGNGQSVSRPLNTWSVENDVRLKCFPCKELLLARQFSFDVNQTMDSHNKVIGIPNRIPPTAIRQLHKSGNRCRNKQRRSKIHLNAVLDVHKHMHRLDFRKKKVNKLGSRCKAERRSSRFANKTTKKSHI